VDCLAVFLKPPRSGSVKTRLASAIGAESAAALYRALAEEELRRTAPASGEYSRLLFFTPADAESEVRRWFPGEEAVAQSGGDLGERLASAFALAFARGARRVAVIGTDIPRVSRARVISAFAALDGHDVVLGPACDGGYYLIALSQPRRELFRGIPWSTSSVLGSTLERARGLRVSTLEPLRDIDTLADVAAEWDELRPLLPAPVILKIEGALSTRRADACP
jgi:rSAM/selenodomain-associated transferase 1